MELYWLSASRGEWRGTRALQERLASTGGSRACPCGSHHKSCTCQGCARVSGCGWWGEEACWFTRSQISPLAEPLHKSRILPLCSLKIDKAPISVASPAVPASFPAPLWGAGLLLEETNQPGPPTSPGSPPGAAALGLGPVRLWDCSSSPSTVPGSELGPCTGSSPSLTSFCFVVTFQEQAVQRLC